MASAMGGGVLEGSLRLTGSGRLGRTGGGRVAAAGPRVGVAVTVRAQQQTHTEAGAAAVPEGGGRRAVLSLIAATLATGSLAPVVHADTARSIKFGPPPLPSGGLSGTLNSDQARDLELKLKDRFYLQPLPPAEAAQRAKEVAGDILKVKAQIDKKAWPYVQNDLRLKGSYLRYDLNTIISSKPRDEKKALNDLTKNLFSKIDGLDYAAKIKSTPQAEKYYAETKSALDEVLAKIG